MKFDNFVLGTLISTIGASSGDVKVAIEPPYRPPPDPGGEIARAIISDALRNPSVFEIVTYTGVDDLGGDVYGLTGVTRGTQGTSGQEWPVGAVIRQDVTAADLKLLELQELDQYVIGCSSDTSIRKINGQGQVVWVNAENDDRVFQVAVSEDGDIYSCARDGVVKRIAPDGTTQWSVEVGTRALCIAHSELGFVVVGGQNESDQERIFGLSDVDGSQLWSVDPDDFFAGPATRVSVNKKGVVCSAHSFDANNPNVLIIIDGSVAFNIVDNGTPLQAAIDDDGFVYYQRSDPPAIVKMSINGHEEWAQSISVGGNLIFGRNGVFYLRSGTDVFVVDRSDGSLTLAFTVPQRSVLRSVSVDGTAFVALARSVRAFSPSGAQIWSYDQFLNSVSDAQARNVSMSSVVSFSDSDFKLRSVRRNDLAGPPYPSDLVRLTSGTEPEIPPAGHVWLFVDSGELKAKFSNGNVFTIASAT